ncbi:MAG: HAD family hydrolase [Chitinophagaceae bacterium]
MPGFNTIIFDLGGVLIDWNPRYVFHDQYFDSPEKQAYFFENICTSDWNEEQDAGRSIVEATQLLVQQFPDWEPAIRDYYGRWTDMLGGPINDTVEIFRRIKQNPSLRTYALTNWQASLFEIALVRYDFLHWFDGRVVSGEEKTRKPFPEFYQRLLNRYSVQAHEALFIDDNQRNVNAALELGIESIHFKSPEQLQSALREHGIL